MFSIMDLNGDNQVDKLEFKKILNDKLKSFFSKKSSDADKHKQTLMIDR